MISAGRFRFWQSFCAHLFIAVKCFVDRASRYRPLSENTVLSEPIATPEKPLNRTVFGAWADMGEPIEIAHAIRMPFYDPRQYDWRRLWHRFSHEFRPCLHFVPMRSGWPATRFMIWVALVMASSASETIHFLDEPISQASSPSNHPLTNSS